MNQSTRLVSIDRARWQTLASSFADHNYRQMWAFGMACAERQGAESEHVALLRGDEVIALADVRVKRLPVLSGGMAYVAGGPLVRRSDDAKDAAANMVTMLEALRAEYADRRGLIVRCRPGVGPEAWNHEMARCYQEAGYGLSVGVNADQTMLLDLSRDLTDIRTGFAQKWRNSLNASERTGVVVRAASSADDWRCFIDLHDSLRLTKGFEVDLDANFYRRVHERAEVGDWFELLLAELNGRPIAAHLSSSLGDTCVYLLGASSEEGRRCKASYLLQWQAIINAWHWGLEHYDLGGIDQEASPGVYRFKRGMGGTELTAPGPFEASPGVVNQAITLGAERIWRSCQGVRRRAETYMKTTRTRRAA